MHARANPRPRMGCVEARDVAGIPGRAAAARAYRVAASFAAWRASLAKANEARRANKQREAEREACERTSEALLAAAIAEREDLRRQLAALKAGVAAEREAAAPAAASDEAPQG